MDMELKLEKNLKDIVKEYADYVDCLRARIEEQKISLDNLRTFLLAIPALSCHSRGTTLTALSDEEAELRNKKTINEIFNFLLARYASFLNYEVFEDIREYCEIIVDREELNYPKHLSLFLRNHEISAFEKINPYLKKCDVLEVKFDVEKTCQLAKVSELKKFVAKALDLNPSALRIVDVAEGCIVVTFLIPTAVAKTLFAKLSLKQEDLLRESSVRWLKCNGRTFDIPKRRQNKESHSVAKGIVNSNLSYNFWVAFSRPFSSRVNRIELLHSNLRQ